MADIKDERIAQLAAEKHAEICFCAGGCVIHEAFIVFGRAVEAQSRNYVADSEINPQCVTFANGRTVVLNKSTQSLDVGRAGDCGGDGGVMSEGQP